MIFIRKLSIRGADLEFEICDVDVNGYVTWKEYVDEIYSENNIDEEVIIIKFII